ncbi:transposase [Streptomyces violaceusniger]|uniref:transposase n=1 Tax=Streptomyces violaceusniger TaxID=68280 RepID=UPI0031DFF356
MSPPEQREVAQAAFPKGCLATRIRDALGPLFSDEEFREAFGVRGRPGISPGRLALVSILQFAENLTDRQAAHAVRARIDVKYLLGLELTDPGFDHTVLTGFRDSLLAHGLEGRILDLLLGRLADMGPVAAGGGSAPTPHMSWLRSGPSTAWSSSGRRCGPRWRRSPRRRRTGCARGLPLTGRTATGHGSTPTGCQPTSRDAASSPSRSQPTDTASSKRLSHRRRRHGCVRCPPSVFCARCGCSVCPHALAVSDASHLGSMEYEAPSNVHPSVPSPMLRRMVGACDLTREISRHPGSLPTAGEVRQCASLLRRRDPGRSESASPAAGHA